MLAVTAQPKCHASIQFAAKAWTRLNAFRAKTLNKTNTIFVQNDVKQKYLKNLFQQIVKDYRLDVQENYQLKAKEIKTVVDNIELKSNNGISLRVGGNVLTVNPSGIHLNASLVDTTSGNCGVRVEESKNKKISNIGLKDDNE